MCETVLIYKDDICEINFDYLEVNNKPSVNCHMDIFKWTKSTRPFLLKVIETVLKDESLDKYAVWDGKNKTFLKFITMIGFKDTKCFTEAFGQREYMFIWSNK